MATNEKIEVYSKTVELLSGVLKLTGTTLLVTLGAATVAAPDFIKDRLDKLGIKIAEINAPGIKLVSKESQIATSNAIKIADALSEAEATLGEASAIDSPDAEKKNNAITEALKSISAAKINLDTQVQSINKTAELAGLAPADISSGWIYVGYFNLNGKTQNLSRRIGSSRALQYKGDKISAIILQHDAPIIANGDDCSTQDIADFKATAPNALDAGSAIIKKSNTPLIVTSTSECPGRGSGKFIWAKVEIPKDRIRVASLKSID